MLLSDLVENEKNKIRNQYIDSPERIVSDYKKEREKIEDYNGRQLLELLQNADDASDFEEYQLGRTKHKEVLIKLTKDMLIVANNGEPFSDEGIISLMYSNLSQKAMKQNKIGNKGTGFRSILNWAKSVYIKSYDLSVKFSRDCAVKFLKDILSVNPDIKQRIEKYTKEEYPIATLLVPEWIDDVADYNEYDTFIAIELVDDAKVLSSIQEQINSLDKEVLLFVHNLCSIKIESPERNVTIRKEPGAFQKSVKISIVNEREEIESKEWRLNEKVGEYNGRSYELVIAYNDSLDDNKNVIYSYFKTDVRFPFPAVIHGTFDLSGNRNELNRSSENEFLFEKLIELLTETAISIAENNDKADYATLKLLAFDNEFDPVVKDLKFESKFLSKIVECKVFPTISGEYVDYSVKPIFYDNPYADILPSEVFKKLMPFTEENSISKLINKIQRYVYTYDFLVNSINSIAHTLTNNQRAKLLKYILVDYSEDISKKESIKPLLLVDTEGQLIETGIEVFLPEKNDIFSSVPSYAKLRFMNRHLYELIKKELSTNSARIIADEKLKTFNVSEYSFAPVLRGVSGQTKLLCEEEPQNKQIYMKEFVSWLLTIYSSNVDKSLPPIPASLNIPLLNRDGKIQNADEMFFGKEYQNILGDHLLSKVASDKFICYHDEYELRAADEQAIIDFFKWIGVSFYPRVRVGRLKPEEQKKYINYVFERLKPIKVGEYVFPDIESLKNRISSIASLEVAQVEFIDEILEKSNFEHVLAWMIKDEKINNSINSETEKDTNSKIDIYLKQCNYTRKVTYNQMASYILWKIRLTFWIETKSGNKAYPGKCCLAKNINNDFSPLIEVPDVDYSDEIFKNYKISRDDIEYWLNKIGIPKDFSDFTTSTAYSILLKLPEVDTGGKNARPIYRQMIQTSEEEKWDKSDSIFRQFMKDGNVYANLCGQKSYFPINEVYYLDNRMFCEDIIKQFPILELEKRAGKQKVQAILGVKPLENIKFRITGFDLHSLDKRFAVDLESFLPYVYCFRIEKDTNHRELNALKNTKLFLCANLNACYTVDGEEKPFEVNAYEYIYLEEEKQVFIKVEQGKHNSIQELKSDFRFCETIAEVFSGIIKVEENRKDFRELYSKSLLQRDDTLRSDLDDQKLSKLYEARTWLGICADSKVDFWNTIFRAINEEATLPEEDEALHNYLSQRFKLESNLADELFNDFNYDDFQGSEKYLGAVIRLLKKINIDVSDFNAHTVKEISLDDYYKKRIENLKNAHMKKFHSLLYSKLLNESIETKKEFESKKAMYSNLEVPIINSINFDYEKVFYEMISITKKYLLSVKEIDLHDMFFENKKEFLDRLDEVLRNTILDDEFNSFCEKHENKSLIYFGEYESLKTAIKTYIESLRKGQVSASNEGQRVQKSFKDVLNEIINNSNTVIVNAESQKPSQQLNGENGRNGVHSGGGRVSEKQKEEIGFKGECYVYKELIKLHGESHVDWVSEYAKKAEVNADGVDGLGYDLKYINCNNNKYVEVKATSGDEVIFYITKDEVAFAESHRDSYELIVVLNVLDDKKRRAINLGNIFGYTSEETFSNNGRFIVENKDFRIKAEIKQA